MSIRGMCTERRATPTHADTRVQHWYRAELRIHVRFESLSDECSSEGHGAALRQAVRQLPRDAEAEASLLVARDARGIARVLSPRQVATGSVPIPDGRRGGPVRRSHTQSSESASTTRTSVCAAWMIEEQTRTRTKHALAPGRRARVRLASTD